MRYDSIYRFQNKEAKTSNDKFECFSCHLDLFELA